MLHSSIVDTARKSQHVPVRPFQSRRVYLRSVGLHSESPRMVCAAQLMVIFYQVLCTLAHPGGGSISELVTLHQFLDTFSALQVCGDVQSTVPICFEMEVESCHDQSLCEANNHGLDRYFVGLPYSVAVCRFLAVWHPYCTIVIINALCL